MPASRFPSPLCTNSSSTPRGQGPASATACVGKIRCDWKSSMMTESPSAATTSAAATLRLFRERGLDGGSYPIDRVRLLDHRSIVELWRRRIHVAAGGDDERHVLLAKLGRDRPDVLALQV